MRAAIVAALSLLVLAALPARAEGPTVDDLIDALTRPEGGLSRGLPGRNLEVGTPPPPPAVMLDVKFDHDSSAIGSDAARLLERLGAALQSEKLASDRFLVLGHTNKVGGAAYNQRLSERRALAVLGFLQEKFPATQGRLRAKGLGFAKPSAADPADPANRRVEIVNVTGK